MKSFLQGCFYVSIILLIWLVLVILAIGHYVAIYQALKKLFYGIL